MWMITFADLVSLMLTFFVMLFAMSTIQYDSWEVMTHSLSQRLNPTRADEESSPLANRNAQTVFVQQGADLDYLQALFLEGASDRPLLREAGVTRLEDRLVISLRADGIFHQHGASLNDSGRAAMIAFADLLAHVENDLDVVACVGQIETQSHSTRRVHPSKWELAIARAVAVARELNQAGIRRNIAAFGLADIRREKRSGSGDTDAAVELAGDRVEFVIRDTIGYISHG